MSTYMQTVEWVAHLLGPDGIRPDPRRIASIREMTITSLKDLRAWVGAMLWVDAFLPPVALYSPNLLQKLKTSAREEDLARAPASEQDVPFEQGPTHLAVLVYRMEDDGVPAFLLHSPTAAEDAPAVGHQDLRPCVEALHSEVSDLQGLRKRGDAMLKRHLGWGKNALVTTVGRAASRHLGSMQIGGMETAVLLYRVKKGLEPLASGGNRGPGSPGARAGAQQELNHHWPDRTCPGVAGSLLAPCFTKRCLRIFAPHRTVR